MLQAIIHARGTITPLQLGGFWLDDLSTAKQLGALGVAVADGTAIWLY